MKNVQVLCPLCRGAMVLDEFDITVDPRANKFSVAGEIECPAPECGLVFEIVDGAAVYEKPRGKK